MATHRQRGDGAGDREQGEHPAGAGTRISATRIDHVLPPRRIGLMWHRDRYHSTAFAEFVRVARAVCADLSAQAEAR